MASRRADRRAKCTGKIRHDKAGAFLEAARLRRSKELGDQFDAYTCPFCGGWHVGHRTKKARQVISTRKRLKKEGA